MSGWTDSTPALPFNGIETIARHCSQQAAQKALPKAGTQAWTIYLLLRDQAWTLHELADKTGLPITTVCARVGWLKRQGLVKATGETKIGPCGTANHVLIAVKEV